MQDDTDIPDLSKVQLAAWTILAVVVFAVRVVFQLRKDASPSMPDIDSTLMVLMGLGQGAYIGKKLTTTDTPRLLGVSPTSASRATDVTVVGVSFGPNNANGVVTLDGAPLHATSWTDTQVTFKVPDTQPNGSKWSPGQRVLVGVIAGGRDSANVLPLTVL